MSNDMKLFLSSLKFRYKLKFSLSWFIITWLPCIASRSLCWKFPPRTTTLSGHGPELVLQVKKHAKILEMDQSVMWGRIYRCIPLLKFRAHGSVAKQDGFLLLRISHPISRKRGLYPLSKKKPAHFRQPRKEGSKGKKALLGSFIKKIWKFFEERKIFHRSNDVLYVNLLNCRASHLK